MKPILGSQPRFGLVLNLDLSQISKLRAFREYPRQKYSNPVPPTTPELASGFRRRIDYFNAWRLRVDQFRFDQDVWRSQDALQGLGWRLYEADRSVS